MKNRTYNDYCALLTGKPETEVKVKKPKSVTITREDLARAWDKDVKALPSKISAAFNELCKNLKLE